MARISLLSSPFVLGFDRLEREIERLAKSAGDVYPPYNIEQTGDSRWRVSLAVAGFAAADLSVSLEQNQLVVNGDRGEDRTDRDYLHRGIAARPFQRRFMLADGMEVLEARLENGLLIIDLALPETAATVQKIPIKTGMPGRDASEAPGKKAEPSH